MTEPSRRATTSSRPRTPFQTRVSAQRRVAFGSLPLDDVKTIKTTFGCTVNDVVLAVCAAGLRCWLEERGELPTEPLLGIIPVSVRTREQMGTFGNQVSAMTVELPTNMADAGERLRRVSQTMSTAKKQHRVVARVAHARRHRASFPPPCSPRPPAQCPRRPGFPVSISPST